MPRVKHTITETFELDDVDLDDDQELLEQITGLDAKQSIHLESQLSTNPEASNDHAAGPVRSPSPENAEEGHGGEEHNYPPDGFDDDDEGDEQLD